MIPIYDLMVLVTKTITSFTFVRAEGDCEPVSDDLACLSNAEAHALLFQGDDLRGFKVGSCVIVVI